MQNNDTVTQALENALAAVGIFWSKERRQIILAALRASGHDVVAVADCPKCEGTGLKRWPNSAKTEGMPCPACKGTGKAPVEDGPSWRDGYVAELDRVVAERETLQREVERLKVELADITNEGLKALNMAMDRKGEVERLRAALAEAQCEGKWRGPIVPAALSVPEEAPAGSRVRWPGHAVGAAREGCNCGWCQDKRAEEAPDS